MTSRARERVRVITSVETGTKYRLRELLGKGGFGSVWRCESATIDRPLCLKMTRDQASWHREAYMAELVGSHPRVVHVFETFPVVEGKKVSYAVVMELAERGTLADVVTADGAWKESRAVSEMSKILGAVDRLHSSGALHRDITPFNVFACGAAGTTLKLGDFGITTHGPQNGVAANAFAPWFVAIREEQRLRWDVREYLWQVAQVLGVLLTGKSSRWRSRTCGRSRAPTGPRWSSRGRPATVRPLRERARDGGGAAAWAEGQRSASTVSPSQPRRAQRGVHRLMTGLEFMARLAALIAPQSSPRLTRSWSLDAAKA